MNSVKRWEDNPYIKRIRTMVLSALSGEDVRIYLFGSWARGTPKQSSDVDIAVEYKTLPNRQKIGELAELLEESTVPYRVDVVDMAFASSAIVEAIRKEGVLWRD